MRARALQHGTLVGILLLAVAPPLVCAAAMSCVMPMVQNATAPSTGDVDAALHPASGNCCLEPDDQEAHRLGPETPLMAAAAPVGASDSAVDRTSARLTDREPPPPSHARRLALSQSYLN